MSKNPTKLIAFNVSLEVNDRLMELAKARGFSSPSTYARAVLENSLGKPDVEIALLRVAEIRNKIQNNLVTLLASSFNGITIEELMKDDE